VSGTDDLHRLLTESIIGRKVPTTVIRGTDRHVLEVTPEETRRR